MDEPGKDPGQAGAAHLTAHSSPLEFHYKVAWRARGYHPGYHRSVASGAGFEFKGHAPLFDFPDPRRLDLHASLRDPLGGWRVRMFRSRASIPVFLVADLSASMETGEKKPMLADFAESLAFSAYRTGDAFGFVGCDDRVREDFYLAPTRAKGAGAELSGRLRDCRLSGRSAQALSGAVEYLSRQRALVFLASDFHFPLELLDEVLRAFSRHDVVPVVIWDTTEWREQTGFGTALLRDSETGHLRSVVLRASFRKKIFRALRERQSALDAAFVHHSVRPALLRGAYHADAMTAYFHGGEPW